MAHVFMGKSVQELCSMCNSSYTFRMISLNIKIPFPKSSLGRFSLNVGIILLIIFISGVLSANGTCVTLGSGARYSCTSIESGINELMVILGLSSYILMLPIIIPALLLTYLMNAATRLSNYFSAQGGT